MAYERVEVITSVERRRRWSVQDKLRLVAESHQAAGGVGVVADRAGLHRSLLQRWRRQVRDGTLVVDGCGASGFVPVAIDDRAPVATTVVGSPHDAVRRLVEIDLPNGCRVRVEQDIPGLLDRLRRGRAEAAVAPSATCWSPSLTGTDRQLCCRWMREELLRSGRLFVDETRAPVLDPGRGRTKTGYFWAIARDDRGCNGSDPPAVVYSYAPGRGADHAIALLKGFAGILQTDGYAAYKTLVEADRARDAIALAHCWAHARRRFFELAKGGSAPIAEEALRRIAKLYAIEAEIRGQDADTRKAARQAHSRPLAQDLKLWLEAKLATVASRSPLAEAVRYALARWDGLTRFLGDGRIELDTNPVERSIRPIALNRKNALFAGSDEGAENWAVLATLIECCKLHGVNPTAYLTDVLTRLVNGHLESRLGELTPWRWQAAATSNASGQAPAQR